MGVLSIKKGYNKLVPQKARPVHVKFSEKRGTRKTKPVGGYGQTFHEPFASFFFKKLYQTEIKF